MLFKQASDLLRHAENDRRLSADDVYVFEAVLNLIDPEKAAGTGVTIDAQATARSLEMQGDDFLNALETLRLLGFVGTRLFVTVSVDELAPPHIREMKRQRKEG
jgi:hypothetical protein